MIFDDVIKSRRSIRKFSSREVPEKDVAAIINTARIGPSAKNRQPWCFFVLTGESRQQFINDYYRAAKEEPAGTFRETGEVMQSAPVLIAVYALGQTKADLLSIGGAMYAMCLKATDLGYGSLWAADTDILRKEEKYRLLAGVVIVGYAEESPSQRSRKSLREISNIDPWTDTCIIEDMVINPDLSGSSFVFISYSHQDKETVAVDIVEMKHHGIPLWYDRELLYGRFWNTQALGMIRKGNCKVFILYVSYSSLSSMNVLKEFREACRNEETKIIPVLIGKTSVKELIQKLREDGLAHNADVYESYFGPGDEMLCISRSSVPLKCDHFQKLLNSLFENGISRKYEAYDHFLYVIKNEECTITGYNGTGTEIHIPESISGFPVTAVGESSFAGHKTIEYAFLPRTIKRLGPGAFKGTGLRSIDLPFTVVEVQTACFRDCRQLEKVTIKEGITYLAEALFRGCVKLKEFTAPNTVTRMEEAVFRNCCSVEEIVLPDSLQNMTEGGFYGCRSLKKLVIPASVVGAEIQSFDTCPALDRVRIGEFVFEHGKGKKYSGPV